MDIITISAVLSIVNIAIQVIDMHTTIECIKTGKGSESNKRLAGWLNDPGLTIGARFRRLALLKGVAIVLVWLPTALLFWCKSHGVTPTIAGGDVSFVAPLALFALAWYYAPIMWSNWKIYRG